MGAYFLRCGAERKNLAINTGFADTPRDELSVLGTEVKYDDGFVMSVKIQNNKTPVCDRTSER